MASTLRFDNWENTEGQLIASSGDGRILKPALVQVSPEAATFVTGTGSVSSSGTVSYTGCTAVELDGVFSADYANYKIVYNPRKVGTNVNNNFEFQLRSNGSNISGGYHSGLIQYSVASGAATNLGSYNRSSAIISRVYYQGSGAAVIDMYLPFSGPFLWRGSGRGDSAAIGEMAVFGGDTPNEGDGISFTISGNTMNGTIQIYGYTGLEG